MEEKLEDKIYEVAQAKKLKKLLKRNLILMEKEKGHY